MAAPPQWQNTLVEVEQSISDCLATLEKYEAAFARVLAENGANPKAAWDASSVWDAKLGLASRTAEDVEGLLAEQDGVWNRWRETLASWHGLIEQPQ